MAGYQLITATPWTRGKAFITAVVAFAFVCGLLIGYAVYSNLNTGPTSGKVFIRIFLLRQAHRFDNLKKKNSRESN